MFQIYGQCTSDSQTRKYSQFAKILMSKDSCETYIPTYIYFF